MKPLRFKKSTVTITLLVLLSLNIFVAVSAIVNAAPVKNPTVYITGDGSVELTWKSGKSATLRNDTYMNLGGLASITITPDHGWHIEVVLFDGISQEILDEDGYSVFDVAVKRAISITFVENGGIDDVDTGANTTAYPNPDVGLLFTNVLTDGFAYAYIIGLQQLEQIGDSWDINTNATFDQNVTVCLVFQVGDLPEGIDPNDLVLWRTEVALGDVNLDGVVDGTDVSIIANANPDEYYPNLDLNNDGFVNDEDVVIASSHMGEESVWQQLESWVIMEGNLVYVCGVTDHFSVFGVTKRN